MKGNSAEIQTFLSCHNFDVFLSSPIPLRSMLASNIPVTAVFDWEISLRSSPAVTRCLNKGWTRGDSKTGSMGSKGLIR
jgi:hypothetical protein